MPFTFKNNCNLDNIRDTNYRPISEDFISAYRSIYYSVGVNQQKLFPQDENEIIALFDILYPSTDSQDDEGNPIKVLELTEYTSKLINPGRTLSVDDLGGLLGKCATSIMFNVPVTKITSDPLTQERLRRIYKAGTRYVIDKRTVTIGTGILGGWNREGPSPNPNAIPPPPGRPPEIKADTVRNTIGKEIFRNRIVEVQKEKSFMGEYVPRKIEFIFIKTQANLSHTLYIKIIGDFVLSIKNCTTGKKYTLLFPLNDCKTDGTSIGSPAIFLQFGLLRYSSQFFVRQPGDLDPLAPGSFYNSTLEFDRVLNILKNDILNQGQNNQFPLEDFFKIVGAKATIDDPEIFVNATPFENEKKFQASSLRDKMFDSFYPFLKERAKFIENNIVEITQKVNAVNEPAGTIDLNNGDRWNICIEDINASFEPFGPITPISWNEAQEGKINQKNVIRLQQVVFTSTPKISFKKEQQLRDIPRVRKPQ
jgi:hypothetical protein